MVDLLIKGNSKMGEYVSMFNLPAKKTCTPTKGCLEGKNGKPKCYALRDRCLWPNVIHGANTRYQISQQPDFSEKMIKTINRKKPQFFRVHSSGDFYSEEYVQKWMKIAQECQDTLFRTTTRRRDLTESLQELNSIPNFIVRESLDSERTEPAMDLPFAALSSLDITKEKETYVCADDCTACNHYCWKQRDNVVFDEF